MIKLMYVLLMPVVLPDCVSFVPALDLAIPELIHGHALEWLSYVVLRVILLSDMQDGVQHNTYRPRSHPVTLLALHLRPHRRNKFHALQEERWLYAVLFLVPPGN